MINSCYYFMVHPLNEKNLTFTAKEEWKMKYRTQRLAKKGRFEPLMRGELGTIQGFRFIENAHD